MSIVVTSKVKMLIVQKCHCSAEADDLSPIIKQQANEIVKLYNKIRVFEQDRASSKSELQEKAISLNLRAAE